MEITIKALDEKMVLDLQSALRVIQETLILARTRAATKCPELVSLLDDIEYLPTMLLDTHDRSDAFRDYARMMSVKHQWQRIGEIFEQKKDP